MPDFDWRSACIDAERRYTEASRELIEYKQVAHALYSALVATARNRGIDVADIQLVFDAREMYERLTAE